MKGGEREGFVLIRALEPVEGIDLMRRRRKKMKPEDLCNGPAKLTQALGIQEVHHGCDPFTAEGWELVHGTGSVETLVSTRIGISQATDYLWRFLMGGSRCVSKG